VVIVVVDADFIRAILFQSNTAILTPASFARKTSIPVA
jgi:hypothetical protein